jgi:hypothetical protein
MIVYKRRLVDAKPGVIIDKIFLKNARTNFLKETKKERIISQIKVSNVVGRIRKQVIRWEDINEKRLPPPDIIKKLCLLYQIDPINVFGLKWEEYKEEI